MREICLILLLSVTCAAQDVPPPPKQPPQGPSLVDTMKFIGDKVGEQGRINYMVYFHDAIQNTDWSESRSVEISRVRASAADCRIDFHWHEEINGKVTADGDPWFLLKDVRDIVVMPLDQHLKELNSAAGHPEWSSRTDPPVFALIARRPNKVANEFQFFDESMANRVAKALAHAVELCGGGSDEPF